MKKQKVTKRLLFFAITVLFLLSVKTPVWGQITLRISPYTESLDSSGSGLPSGYTVRTGASSSTLGTSLSFSSTQVSWGNTSGNFRNVASADGLNSSSTTTNQNNSTDRAVGLLQTGSFGDPGAAFVLQLANTTSRQSLILTFKFQTLDEEERITNFTVDYGIGATPTIFNSVTTVSSGTFGSQSVVANFGAALDNETGPIFIRIVALTASMGANDRDTVGIDDISLSFVGPTAAAVEVSGRVTQPNGRGIMNVRMTMTDSQGNARTTLTDMFGRFRFTDVAAGQTYIFSASHRRYQFEQPTQVQFVGEETGGINFIGTGGIFNLNSAPNR